MTALNGFARNLPHTVVVYRTGRNQLWHFW